MDTSEGETSLTEGTTFGSYRIVRRLGAGAMGTVYEAVHTQLDKRVAVKVLQAEMATNAGARARFLREGKAASRIRHPHIVDVVDVGVQDGLPYLVMELMEGSDLGQWIERRGALSVTETIGIMVPVCAAVAAAHVGGVVHRDLKPDNIFLARNTLGQEVPKVLDFGISKVAGQLGLGLTGTDALLGTPYYMSPEQTTGAKDLDARSDQYTLGVILYECLTGTRPFDGASLMHLLMAINKGDCPRPSTLRPEIPQRLEDVIARAMSHEPSDRFASVDELTLALLPFGDARTRATWEPVLLPHSTTLSSGDTPREHVDNRTPPPSRQPISGESAAAERSSSRISSPTTGGTLEDSVSEINRLRSRWPTSRGGRLAATGAAIVVSFTGGILVLNARHTAAPRTIAAVVSRTSPVVVPVPTEIPPVAVVPVAPMVAVNHPPTVAPAAVIPTAVPPRTEADESPRYGRRHRRSREVDAIAPPAPPSVAAPPSSHPAVDLLSPVDERSH